VNESTSHDAVSARRLLEAKSSWLSQSVSDVELSAIMLECARDLNRDEPMERRLLEGAAKLAFAKLR
jgi:hypothetical protein